MGTSDGESEGPIPSISQSIIEAVAEREGVDVTEVEPPQYEPLYTVVNPEALDDLFSRTLQDDPRGPGRVDFTYAGYDVTAFNDGRVELSATDPAESEAASGSGANADGPVRRSTGN